MFGEMRPGEHVSEWSGWENTVNNASQQEGMKESMDSGNVFHFAALTLTPAKTVIFQNCSKKATQMEILCFSTAGTKV